MDQASIVYILILSSLAFFTVVIPNSFQNVSALVMVVCFIYSFFNLSVVDISKKFLFFLYMSFVVTLLYLIVGLNSSAPGEAVKQVVIIYMLSPIIWFFILTFLLVRIGEYKLVKCFIPIAWICCASVMVFFYLFENYGSGSVSLFKENANLNTKDGYSGATMHVFGSLIFFVGAFFSAPEVIKNKLVMIATLSFLVFCAVASGRSMLIISVPIGVFIFLFFSSGRNISFKNRLGLFLSFIIAGFVVFYVALSFRGIDFSVVMNIILDKIFSGGGSARSIEIKELVDSFGFNYGLGVGHGVGVDFIASPAYPWRYEVVWFATLHRVGLIGSIVYCLPFLLYIYLTFCKNLKSGLSSIERFFFGGFVCVFIASNTNPYIEAFTFQWMYMLPVLAFYIREKHYRNRLV